MATMNKAVLLIVLALAAGCQSFNPSRWDVELNPLDAVQFLVTPAEGSDAEKRREAIRVEVIGTGYCAYVRGDASRVMDAFWKDRDKAGWHNYTTDQIVLSEADTLAIFQGLVDTGLFESSLKQKDVDKNRAILVYAQIDGRKRVTYTDDPAVLKLLRDLLKRF